MIGEWTRGSDLSIENPLNSAGNFPAPASRCNWHETAVEILLCALGYLDSASFLILSFLTVSQWPTIMERTGVLPDMRSRALQRKTGRNCRIFGSVDCCCRRYSKKSKRTFSRVSPLRESAKLIAVCPNHCFGNFDSRWYSRW